MSDKRHLANTWYLSNLHLPGAMSSRLETSITQESRTCRLSAVRDIASAINYGAIRNDPGIRAGCDIPRENPREPLFPICLPRVNCESAELTRAKKNFFRRAITIVAVLSLLSRTVDTRAN